MTKTTKESLIIELAKIKQAHTVLISDDEYKRKEFAKAFSSGIVLKQYYSETGVRASSWEEIFVEIGKLLAKQKRLNYISDVENLKLKTQEIENNLQNLEQRLLKKVNPNL